MRWRLTYFGPGCYSCYRLSDQLPFNKYKFIKQISSIAQLIILSAEHYDKSLTESIQNDQENTFVAK